MTTYKIVNMRFVKTSGKVADRHPDRVGTVYGSFYDVTGKNKLSITSKNVDREDALDTNSVIDIENGILTLPSGERGRKPSVSASQEDVNSLLDSLRAPAE